MLALLAQAAEKEPSNAFATLVPLVLIGGLFYLLMIRPQRRNMRAQQELMRSLDVGDEVETIGGIFGVIKRLDDESLWVDIAPGTEVRVSRRAVRRVVTGTEGGDLAG